MSEQPQVSGYEIRANMLHLAKEILEQRMSAGLALMSQNATNGNIGISDIIFNHADVIKVAADLYKFVQTK